MINRNSGIYTITNLINGKIYIGYTINFYNRWASHKSTLILNNHVNKYLQRTFNKYGINNFKFEILEECDLEYLASQENYWVQMLCTYNPKYGYNSKSTHPNNKPSPSITTIEKIRLGNLGKKRSDEVKKKISLSSKGRRLGIPHTQETKSKISKSRKGRCSGKDNYFYGKTHNNEVKKKMSEAKQGKYIGKNNPNFGNIWNVEQRENLSKQRKIKIIQMELNGSFIRGWDSADDASKNLQIIRSNITACCKGRIKTAGGFKWEYKDENIFNSK